MPRPLLPLAVLALMAIVATGLLGLTAPAGGQRGAEKPAPVGTAGMALRVVVGPAPHATGETTVTVVNDWPVPVDYEVFVTTDGDSAHPLTDALDALVRTGGGALAYTGRLSNLSIAARRPLQPGTSQYFILTTSLRGDSVPTAASSSGSFDIVARGRAVSALHVEPGRPHLNP